MRHTTFAMDTGTSPVPPRRPLPPVRTGPAQPMPDAELVGAAIAPDDLSGWYEALHAVDFDLQRLHWFPSDYQACASAFLTGATDREQAGDFVRAGQHYLAAHVLARHGVNHLEAGSEAYVACCDLQTCAKLGLERCAQALRTPEPATSTRPATPMPAAQPLAHMPEAVQVLVQREIDRLNAWPGGSEAEMNRRYVDWCLALPWNRRHPGTIDVREAKRILDAEHEGLDKVKTRILEEIAVQKRVGHPAGKVLCLVGPPGVGKTSVVKSISRALGKTLLRQSLGGVADEMEIRGNNRAYTGAQPSRLVQAMCGAGFSDPVVLLDEIDKMVKQTHHGDPSAALLELLDPEQNHAFKDAYLGFGYDVSQVTFIATANYLDDIPPALRDRLEIISLSGYTPLEKQSIGRKHLLPKQMRVNKLEAEHLHISDAALAHIIRYYTQEPGVRQLEKQVAAICRKVVAQLEAYEIDGRVEVRPDTVAELLGPPRYRESTRMRHKAPGLVNGLAWTQAGGVMLPVQARVHLRGNSDGGGKLVLTGNVRKVMQESSSIALNFLRTSHAAIGESLRTRDIYLHVPDGAMEKDGPSAGVTFVTALYAALTQRLVPDDIAMTGEIGLFGEVRPVGGIKEKSLAAYTNGCKRLFLPEANRVDLEEVPAEVKDNLEIVFLEHCSELLTAVFGPHTAGMGAALGDLQGELATLPKLAA